MSFAFINRGNLKLLSFSVEIPIQLRGDYLNIPKVIRLNRRENLNRIRIDVDKKKKDI